MTSTAPNSAPSPQPNDDAAGPAKPRKPQINLTVRETLQLSPTMIRVVAEVQQPELFQDIEPPEKYVKLVFFNPALGLDAFPDYWSLKDSLPADQQPVTRHMTLRKVAADRSEVWIDVATHGDSGYAGPWAMHAQPGDTMVVVGPGGKWIPDPAATWTLLAGDDTAIPAIMANVEALPAGARGEVILEVDGAENEQDLSLPEGLKLRWCHRNSQEQDTRALVEAVKTTTWPQFTDGVQVFAHGEREAMKMLRPLLFEHHGLSRDQVSISGYWAAGRTEEAFQAEKRTPIGKV